MMYLTSRKPHIAAAVALMTSPLLLTGCAAAPRGVAAFALPVDGAGSDHATATAVDGAGGASTVDGDDHAPWRQWAGR